ncbi:hypothetical protein BG57_12835 [Caballeronia grimmiae]|jgi:hypothetical protein|uniref:Uncharacterized protein n=1 Tax=Caballeronia grimmiae TaxID=1071679 RepID=A0A069NTE4_9BURK|nr:hypothetical protein BG57_12835 [Caballeronia grimmiae]
MHRSHPILGAVALAACLASSLLFSPVSSHAAEPLIDPHMLSAAPFSFQADRAIFSRMSPPPSDSRIFSPRESLKLNESSQFSQADTRRRQSL